MSMNSFTEFLKKVQQDPGLQKELRSKFGDPAAGIPGKALADFAAGKGYKFTAEEIPGELSDEQLGGVAGGAYDYFLKFEGLQKVFPKVEGGRLFLKFESFGKI